MAPIPQRDNMGVFARLFAVRYGIFRPNSPKRQYPARLQFPKETSFPKETVSLEKSE